jgi:hypothetical protein
MLLLFTQLLGLAAVCATVIAAAPLAQRLTTPQTMPQCEVGQWPEFRFGFAALHLDLGAEMGEPLECEHALNAVGDTDQHTSMGVAHYDNASNTPSFHHASDNWALTAKGLVFWSGGDTQVPATALAIPSPGSARLAGIALQNSTIAVASVLGGGHKPAAAPPKESSWLSTIQIGRVATLLGIKNEQVESMTAADLSLYTQQSQGSVAQVTRSINSEAEAP